LRCRQFSDLTVEQILRRRARQISPLVLFQAPLIRWGFPCPHCRAPRPFPLACGAEFVWSRLDSFHLVHSLPIGTDNPRCKPWPAGVEFEVIFRFINQIFPNTLPASDGIMALNFGQGRGCFSLLVPASARVVISAEVWASHLRALPNLPSAILIIPHPPSQPPPPPPPTHITLWRVVVFPCREKRSGLNAFVIESRPFSCVAVVFYALPPSVVSRRLFPPSLRRFLASLFPRAPF